MKKVTFSREIISWAMYDFANSAFATTVMAGFFPLFFKKYWSSGAAVTESTFYLGVINSVGAVIIALMSPMLGAIADRSSKRKKILLFLTAIGCSMTAALFWIEKGQWMLAGTIYVLGVIGFSGSMTFYDSLILFVLPKDERDEEHLDVVSALGFSLGYLGGGILFALNVAMTVKPEFFGIADKAMAVRYSFLSVAVWWMLFSIPIFLWVKEDNNKKEIDIDEATSKGFKQLINTFKQIKTLRLTFLFLGAYWLYIDGVHTVIRMAVDYGLSLGFKSDSLIKALLITQFVGFPSALVFGKIGQKIGAKTGILIGIAFYVAVTIWGYFMQEEWEFYVLAVVIGLVQGGVQALSRSLFAKIIPVSQSSEFFGFYNMVGKFAAVLGPALMGMVAYFTGSTRVSILSLLILLIGGGILLTQLDEKQAQKNVANL